MAMGDSLSLVQLAALVVLGTGALLWLGALVGRRLRRLARHTRVAHELAAAAAGPDPVRVYRTCGTRPLHIRLVADPAATARTLERFARRRAASRLVH